MRRGTRERRHHHYLKGLLACGRRLSVRFSKGTYTYFYCLGQKDRRNGTDCRERYVAADQLEAEVEDLYGRIQVPSDWADGLRQAIAQVDGPVFCLPPLGTVLRPGPGEGLVQPTDPLVASLPVQRRLAPGEVAELVAAYRRGVPVEELAALFRVNRTTVLSHVRRHGVPKRDRRALQGDEVDRAVQLYVGGRSVDWVAAQLEVAASTVRRALKDAGVTLRPRGRRRVGVQ